MTQPTQYLIDTNIISELGRSVELIQHRGDRHQADLLENWLQTVLAYGDRV